MDTFCPYFFINSGKKVKITKIFLLLIVNNCFPDFNEFDKNLAASWV